MAAVNSSATKIFPFGSIRNIRPHDNILNEENLARMLSVVTDKKSYIVDYDDASKLLKCVVEGYYIETEFTPKSGSKEYIVLDIEDSADGTSYLRGIDTPALSTNQEIKIESESQSATVDTSKYLKVIPGTSNNILQIKNTSTSESLQFVFDRKVEVNIDIGGNFDSSIFVTTFTLSHGSTVKLRFLSETVAKVGDPSVEGKEIYFTGVHIIEDDPYQPFSEPPLHSLQLTVGGYILDSSKYRSDDSDIWFSANGRSLKSEIGNYSRASNFIEGNSIKDNISYIDQQRIIGYGILSDKIGDYNSYNDQINKDAGTDNASEYVNSITLNTSTNIYDALGQVVRLIETYIIGSKKKDLDDKTDLIDPGNTVYDTFYNVVQQLGDIRGNLVGGPASFNSALDAGDLDSKDSFKLSESTVATIYASLGNVLNNIQDYLIGSRSEYEDAPEEYNAGENATVYQNLKKVADTANSAIIGLNERIGTTVDFTDLQDSGKLDFEVQFNADSNTVFKCLYDVVEAIQTSLVGKKSNLADDTFKAGNNVYETFDKFATTIKELIENEKTDTKEGSLASRILAIENRLTWKNLD